jgi:hypothetical protein
MEKQAAAAPFRRPPSHGRPWRQLDEAEESALKEREAGTTILFPPRAQKLKLVNYEDMPTRPFPNAHELWMIIGKKRLLKNNIDFMYIFFYLFIS